MIDNDTKADIPERSDCESNDDKMTTSSVSNDANGRNSSSPKSN